MSSVTTTNEEVLREGLNLMTMMAQARHKPSENELSCCILLITSQEGRMRNFIGVGPLTLATGAELPPFVWEALPFFFCVGMSEMILQRGIFILGG